VGLGTVLILSVLAASPSWAAVLGNPGNGRLYSGIGVISGWKCQADGKITVEFLNTAGERVVIRGGRISNPVPLVYGTERTDVRDNGQCLENAHDNVGFVALWNWGELGDGTYTAVAYDNGVEFDRTTFAVGSTGEEFLQGAMRQHLLENFPVPGETTILEWNESTQHFEIRGMLDRPMQGEYDLAYWRQLSRDLSEGTYRTAEFLYAEEPDLDTCRAGELTQAGKERALEAMNQIRALHGLSAVQYSSLYDVSVQEAALIQAANSYLEHFPEPSDSCYTPAGGEGSGSSNLSWAGADVDPARHMVSWTVSPRHRRWLLNPFATYMSYGQVHGDGAQKVFGFEDQEPLTPHITVDYVAFPYETYPFNLVGEGTPWSFSVVEDKRDIWANQYPYFENARIRVVRTSDGASLGITDRYTDPEAFGVPNVLSWQVEGWEYDTLYEVEISNVTLRSGETRSYSYPVFIDRANIEY